MADCGASGTTLDRAARAVLGSSNASQSNASKHLGNLLGHVSAAAAQHHAAAAMPMAAPNQLVLPTAASLGGAEAGLKSSPSVQVAHPPQAAAMGPTSIPQHVSNMDAAWHSPAAAAMHIPMQQYPALLNQPPSLMHQQQQAAMQAMMQQQQQHQFNMMVQQRQLQHQAMLLAEKQKEMQQQQQLIDSKLANGEATQAQTEGAMGHEGVVKGASIEELATAWAEAQSADDDVATVAAGHEGIVEGASIEELAAAWAQAENEYEQLAANGDAHISAEDYLNDDPSNLWTGEMPADFDQQVAPYEFVNTEPPTENLDWMGEGMKYFREGNLKLAIHAFEMELQHQNPDNSTAWRMLGRCHAENDQDPEAIKCLEAAVDRDPYSPEALLALGVSYVNELNHGKALENLKAWFTHNPKYAGMDLPDIYGAPSMGTNGESAFDEVKRLLLSALDIDASDAGDIYEALGVIYNVNKDYEAAAEAFRKAVEARPDDYQLWNKLGATLANGNQSDQALPNYHKALQIKPKYARAWLNMAISHSNLQNHEEAARCYLQTLSLNPSATHCWSYLRMALSCSEKWDLLPLVFDQNVKLFQEHYDFVLYDD